MADIELVIKIPEKTVNDIKDNAMFAGSISSEILWDVTSAIVNGIPLPKGHGDLIDVSKLNDVEIYDRSNDMYGASSDQIMNAETIIEADKRGESE